MAMPVRLAIEWLSNSGPRTAARLDGLVEHFAKVYALSDMLADLQADARKRAAHLLTD